MAYSLFSIQEVVDLLNIDDVSASELLNGTIDFEVEELLTLAHYKHVQISELVNMMQS